MKGGPVVAQLDCATEVRSRRGVVVANTQEAADAGGRILQAGGNAVDAAVATALALGVAEAEASGLGGHAWMLIHLANGRDVAIDGSGTLPAAMIPAEIQRLKDDGLPFGYKTVATPGGLAALDFALRTFGTRSLAEVMAPAIELARDGVRLPPHQEAILGAYGWRMRPSPTLADVFLDPSMEPWSGSRTLCMDTLAGTMARLAQRGAGDLYAGETAGDVEADMVANGGYVRRSDLAAVRPAVLQPVRGRYRGLDVVSFPPPGGGLALVEALQILDTFPPGTLAEEGIASDTLLAQAAHVALVDMYAGWPKRPLGLLANLSVHHAQRRAALIASGRALRDEEILGKTVHLPALGGTTHVSVLDAMGNAVALTQTYNVEFGAAVASPRLGFIYNGSLSLIDFDRTDPAAFRPGAVASPLHTASPTIVLRSGKPVLVLGGPGSGRITSTLVGIVVKLVDRNQRPGEAIAGPRVVWDGGRTPELYVEVAPPRNENDIEELQSRGFHSIYALRFPARVIDLIAFGGVNLIAANPDTGEAVGVGDPRRAGAAATGDPPWPAPGDVRLRR